MTTNENDDNTNHHTSGAQDVQARRERAERTLAVRMDHNDAGAATIGAYMAALLQRLWDEGEGFSGKRPFGNSSWEAELEVALIKAGLVDGDIDSDGFLDRVDSAAASALISEALAEVADMLVPPKMVTVPMVRLQADQRLVMVFGHLDMDPLELSRTVRTWREGDPLRPLIVADGDVKVFVVQPGQVELQVQQ